MPFFWGASSVLPSVMRSAGDASYASYFSLVTMWVVRVGLGYLMAIPMGLGLGGRLDSDVCRMGGQNSCLWSALSRREMACSFRPDG